MNRDFPTAFTAWSFVAAAVLLWGGWMALPVHLDTFFQAEDFGRIAEHFHWWIWTFRLHLFGMVFTVIALVALASLFTQQPARVLVWPGAAVATAGMIVGAVGAAFYYHHGAWGAEDLAGKSSAEIDRFVEALRVDTEYVTCLVRFGRVFSGLGILLVGCGIWRARILPHAIPWLAIAIGLAAMGVTMLLPDRMSLYMPIFHLFALWLALLGIGLLRAGVRLGLDGDGP
jgi:hypothetical protein